MAWRPPPLGIRARLVLIAVFVTVLAVGIFGPDVGGTYTYGRPSRPVPAFLLLSAVVVVAIWSMGRRRP